MRPQPSLLQCPVLRHAQHGDRWRDLNLVRHRLQRSSVNVLKLVGDYVGQACQLLDRLEVIVIRGDMMIADLRGGTFRIRVKRDRAVIHLARRHRQHAAKLTAAVDAQHRTGLQVIG